MAVLPIVDNSSCTEAHVPKICSFFNSSPISADKLTLEYLLTNKIVGRRYHGEGVSTPAVSVKSLRCHS